MAHCDCGEDMRRSAADANGYSDQLICEELIELTLMFGDSWR